MPKTRGGLVTAAVRRRIGRQIQAAREKAGLQGNELAAALGVVPSTVTDWQKGRRAPTLEHLLLIAEVTGESLLFLLDPNSLEDPGSMESLSRQLGSALGASRLELLLSMPRKRLQKALDAAIGEYAAESRPRR